jgi:phosphoenolpyruvate carboxykinase (GTP)
VPLVYEANNWTHGTFLGATLSSETTAAATGKVGVLRRDPMAMLPFCGYNMGDYFNHWLEVGARLANPPHIFRVNWFRTNDEGKFLWPGFGDNLRVLKWILERCTGHGKAVPSAIGPVPTLDAIDRNGLQISDDDLSALLKVDPAEWVEALAGQEDFFRTFGDHTPAAMWDEQKNLAHRIEDAITPHDLHGRDLGT